MIARNDFASAIVANRRMLKLLDQQIDELAKIEPEIAAELGDPDRHQPFSYVVEGVDGRAGIPGPFVASNNVQNPAFGYIRMQSDAAFVATRAFACTQNRQFAQFGITFDATAAAFAPGLRLRAYDESSNRWLFVANNRQLVQQNSAIDASVFGALAISSAGGIELPSECAFPRNALIRVEAYLASLDAFPQNTRVFFILHGYKVFGG